MIYFSHIDIFMTVHEGHINRSKIGNALHVELSYFCTFDAVDAINNICSMESVLSHT